MVGIAHVGVASHPVVDFHVAMLVRTGVGALVLQPGARLGEIVVVRHVAARRDFLRHVVAVDELFLGRGHPFRLEEGDRGVAGQDLVRANIIGQHQGMTAQRMLEVVIDAFVLHQAADEVEVGLLVLHAIGPAAIIAGQIKLQGKTIFPENFLQDRGDALVLEDLAVLGLGKQPQPRTHDGAVAVAARGGPFAAHQHAAPDDAVQVAHRAVARLYFDRQWLAQQRLQVQRVTIGNHVHFKFKQLRQRFGAAQGAKAQHLVTERRVGFYNAFHINFLVGLNTNSGCGQSLMGRCRVIVQPPSATRSQRHPGPAHSGGRTP